MKPNRFLDPIMRDTAIKEKVHPSKVAECMNAQYDFIRRSIESFDPKTVDGPKVIYIPCWGKYIVTDSTVGNLYIKIERDNEAICTE